MATSKVKKRTLRCQSTVEMDHITESVDKATLADVFSVGTLSVVHGWGESFRTLYCEALAVNIKSVCSI